MTKILNNLSIQTRMILSVALFLTTLGLSMYSAYTSIGANIIFAEQEMKGDQYQRPVAGALHEAGILRATLAMAPTDSAAVSIALASLKKIDTYLDDLQKVQNRIGTDLQFTEDGLKSRGRENLKLETISSKWKALSAGITADPKGSHSEKLASLIADFRGLIAHSGDTSNLILDPDLDSYYLMDATLLALPQTIDRLGAIGETLYGKLATDSLSQDDRIEAAVLARVLGEADIARLQADMDTSLKEDANFYDVSRSYQDVAPKLLARYTEDNQAFLAVLQSIAKGEDVRAERFAQTLEKAQNAAYAFLATGYDELDKLLNFRIASYAQQQTRSLITSMVGIVISVLFFIIVVRTITKPLEHLTSTMLRLAENDLQAEVHFKGSKSEIGQMANSIQVFKENGLKMKAMKAEQEEREQHIAAEKKSFAAKLIAGFEASVGSIVETVASASSRLNGSAEFLSSLSQKTSEQATTVAAASEQTSANVQSVSASAERLATSIQDISEQVKEATGMIMYAVSQINATNGKILTLSESSSKIGDVVNLINEIAGQTNLLALNATIEAARAGEAGKGFAVVAGEVKNLATQTARATDEISTSISSMQNETIAAVESIRSISQIIDKISETANSIADAVRVQSSATQEIAENIQQVSASTEDIVQSISQVTLAADSSMGSSIEVQNAANDLSKEAKNLQKEVNNFLGQIKAS